MTNVVRCERCGHQNRVPAAGLGSPRCGHCRAPLPWITDAGEESFADIVERASIPVVVDFWAPWCGPCRTVSPALEEVARDLAGSVKLVKVNLDDAPKLAERFSVRSVPMLLVIREWEVIAHQAGAVPKPALRKWVDQSIGRAASATSTSRK